MADKISRGAIARLRDAAAGADQEPITLQVGGGGLCGGPSRLPRVVTRGNDGDPCVQYNMYSHDAFEAWALVFKCCPACLKHSMGKYRNPQHTP